MKHSIAATALFIAVTVVTVGCSARTPSSSEAPRTTGAVTGTPPAGTPLPSPTIASSPAAPSPAAHSPAAPSPNVTTAPDAPSTVALKVYLVLHRGSDESLPILVPVQRTVDSTPAVARAAVTQLLAGPTDDERAHDLVLGTLGTAIHPETGLLDIEIAGGTATVNLSGDFLPLDLDEGSQPFFLVGLAQVTYTLTQFPSVERVAFESEGRPYDVLEGHEGTLLEHAVRDAYFDQLPVIFLDEPAWGAQLRDPVTIGGRAQVFEGQFQAALVDAATGQILTQQTILADCGETGCTLPGGGAFSGSLSVPPAARGRDINVRVWEPSARDGQALNVVEYPLR